MTNSQFSSPWGLTEPRSGGTSCRLLSSVPHTERNRQSERESWMYPSLVLTVHRLMASSFIAQRLMSFLEPAETIWNSTTSSRQRSTGLDGGRCTLW